MIVEGALKLTVLICIAYMGLEVDSRRPRLRVDPTKPPRDYRPSKWLANSAMDVWYGNKSFVEILSREFKDVVDKLALRPVRASLQTVSPGRKINNPSTGSNQSMRDRQRSLNKITSV